MIKPRRNQAKEKQHATRYGGLPCYYDKPYVAERPRPISPELRAFYEYLATGAAWRN